MFVISEAYDDNTAMVIDLSTYSRKEMSEIDLIRFSATGHDVLGLSVSDKQINYIHGYDCISFATEDEADEYIKDKGLTYRNKKYINGLYWVLEKKSSKIHVDYYVCTWAGQNATYVAERGYTPYIQAAKSFDKKSAGRQAAMMTQHSKTGKHWTTQRIVRRFN